MNKSAQTNFPEKFLAVDLALVSGKLARCRRQVERVSKRAAWFSGYTFSEASLRNAIVGLFPSPLSENYPRMVRQTQMSRLPIGGVSAN